MRFQDFWYYGRKLCLTFHIFNVLGEYLDCIMFVKNSAVYPHADPEPGFHRNVDENSRSNSRLRSKMKFKQI